MKLGAWSELTDGSLDSDRLTPRSGLLWPLLRALPNGSGVGNSRVVTTERGVIDTGANPEPDGCSSLEIAKIEGCSALSEI